MRSFTPYATLLASLVFAACKGAPAKTTPTPKPTPEWCRAAIAEVRKTDSKLDGLDARSDAPALNAVAERLSHEADLLDALARDGAAQILTFAARGDKTFAGFVHLLASRKLASTPHDSGAFERAFYVAARHRTYMAMHVNAHCVEPLHDVQPSQAWVTEATARFDAIRESLEPCREPMHKASGDLPDRLELHARIDERGHAGLVTPTRFAPLSLTAMDALYCAVKALERVSLPAPPSTLTLKIGIEKDGAEARLLVLPF